MSEHFDDAQRVLEQRALRNVRSLVEKLDAEDRERNAGTKRLAVAIFLAIVIGSILAILSTDGDRARSDSVVVQPPPANAAAANAPRRKFVGSGKDTPFAGYVNQYSQKIERLAASSYPSALRGAYGAVQLTAAIRSDGSLERVEINRTSGNPALDAAAEDLVTSAQPFESFAAHSLTDLDFLHITRTFTFAKGTAKEKQ